MRTFTTKKTFYTKSAIFLVIIISLVGGVYAFAANQEFIDNFRPYYLKAYYQSYLYDLDSRSHALASLLGVGGSKVIYTTNARAQSIPVLLYHGLVDQPNEDDVTVQNFKNQMVLLKEHGYQSITLRDFYEFMQEKKELPEKSFLITFDDGRKDSYYTADPILQALHFNAVMFVITEHSLNFASNYYLSKNELGAMAKSGRWELESHGRQDHDLYVINEKGDKGHFLSNKIWLEDKHRIETDQEFKERVLKDFQGAKQDIEKTFGNPVISFSFPFGDLGQYNTNYPNAQEVVLDLMRQVYPLSFYQIWTSTPKQNYPNKDQAIIARIGVNPAWSAEDVLRSLENSNAKQLPFDDNFVIDNGWLKNWGNTIATNNSLTISATPTTTGGATFLDGSIPWKNYFLDVVVQKIKGSSFSLATRYTNESFHTSYATCVYSNDHIVIKERIQDKDTTLAGRLLTNEEIAVLASKTIHAGVQVSGNTVTCMLNGKSILETSNLNPALDYGGIGILTWDPKPGVSQVIARELHVRPI